MRTILFLLACLCSADTLANSSVIKVKVEGNKVHWANSLLVQGSLRAPTFWQHAQSITPTQSWLAGSWTQTPPNNIPLTNGKDSINLPLYVSGLEYNTGSVSPVMGKSSALNLCDSDNYSGNLINVVGANCYAANWLDNGQVVTPFAFTRPLFELTESQILNALSGKSAGLYFGHIHLTSVHRFLLGSVESQYFMAHSVAVEIEYTPSVIYSAQVSGNPRLTPVYQFDQQQVSARTDFSVRVNGYFSQGLAIALSPSKSDYQFNGPNHSVIPYSILCVQCTDGQLVRDGAIIHSQTTVKTGSQTSVQFDLKVYFDQLNLQSVEAGEYWDAFTLILQPEV